MDNLNELLAKVTEFLRSETKTETLVGQQFKLGEFTCVPVISAGMAFGGGGGEGMTSDKKGEGTGAGGGAAIGMAARGFLVTNGKEIQFISTNTSKGLSAAFEKVPELLEKYFDKTKTEKTKEPAKV